jgi:hypothetical protein
MMNSKIKSVLLLATLITGCSIEKPKAPRWDLPINIPLTDSTFTLQKLVQNIDDVVVSDYGLLGIKLNGRVDTTRVGPYLTLEDVFYSFAINPGHLTIPVSLPKNQNFSFSYTENVPLLDSLAIQKAEFSSGILTVVFQNELPLMSSIRIVAHDFVSKSDGSPFSTSFDLGPDASQAIGIDLSEHKVNMTVPGPGQVQKTPISFSGTISTPAESVTLEDGDGFAVDVQLENMQLAIFEGRMNERKVVIDETETGVSLPTKFGGLEGLKLGDARFSMNVFNTISFPMRIDGELTAINSSGKLHTLTFDEHILSSINGEIPTLLKPFENNGADILNFINLPPDKITFASNGYIGDGIAISSVTAEDYMWADYSLEIAAKAVWEKRSFVVDTARILIEPELADLDIDNLDQSFDSEMSNNIKKLAVISTIENHTPAGLQIFFRFATNLEHLQDSPQLTVGPVFMPSAQINNSGIVTKSVMSQTEIQLDEDALELFQNTTAGAKYVYIATDLEIQGSDDIEVQLFSTDFIRLQAYMNVVIDVNLD